MSVKRDLLRLRRGCHQDHRGRNGDQSNDTSHDLSPPFPSISTHIERRPDDHKLGNRGMALPSPSRLIHRSAWKASACWKTPLCAHFDPKSGPRHTVFGALWGFWRPIRSHFRLGADFSNWLSSLENRRVIAPPLCLP